MSDETLESLTPTDSQTGGPRQVPVAEAIKHRRRAQQAESRLQELEQQLEELQSQAQQHVDGLATAESQRDEARSQLTVAENRLAAERLLGEAGVVDLETASTLLSARVDLAEDLDRDAMAGIVEQLLLDKPFLRGTADAALPPKTASARAPRATAAGQLASAAQRAARSGDRKDVAEYLRLRRQASVAV